MAQEFRLSTAQRKALVASKANIDKLQEQINKAKRAGLNVDALQAKLDEARQLRDGLLREYGGVA